MKRLAFALAAAAITVAAQSAAATPSADSRLRRIPYDPDAVVPIHAMPGFAVHIVLSAQEKIVDAGSGENSHCDDPTAMWCIVARKGERDIYVNPHKDARGTNLFVKTDKRNYSFDLVALQDKSADRKRMVYRIQFQYPDDEQASTFLPAGQAGIDPSLILETRLQQRQAPRNWNYAMQAGRGSDEITPTMMYDDGRFTYLRFPNNREFPAIYQVLENGKESLLNFHVERNDTMVVHRVAKRFVLRAGDAVVGLWNEAWDPDGVAPRDGVTVDGVMRSINDPRRPPQSPPPPLPLRIGESLSSVLRVLETGAGLAKEAP